MGPSPADLARIERWKRWVEEYFAGIAAELGTTSSRGAHRRFGDLVFTYDSPEVGAIDLFAATSASMPLLHCGIRAKWERVPPTEAAAAMLRECQRIWRAPEYIYFKR